MRVVVVVVLITLVVGVVLLMADEPDTDELARLRAPAPIELREPIAVPEPSTVAIDLDGVRARMPAPSGWSPMGYGAFQRSSGPAFLVDTLLVQADCFGSCETLDANLESLPKYWWDSRAALGLQFSRVMGKPHRPAPDRVTFDVELRPHSPDAPMARARVLAIRPPGAKRALLCEVVVFGDADALADAAAVCDTIAIE